MIEAWGVEYTENMLCSRKGRHKDGSNRVDC